MLRRVDRPDYQPYLTATYTQAISPAPIHLRLVQSLTLSELPERSTLLVQVRLRRNDKAGGGSCGSRASSRNASE